MTFPGGSDNLQVCLYALQVCTEPLGPLGGSLWGREWGVRPSQGRAWGRCLGQLGKGGGAGSPSRGKGAKPEGTQSLMCRGRKGTAHEEAAAGDLSWRK